MSTARSPRQQSARTAPATARGARRHEAIRAAAQSVFLEHGYSGTSVDAVVRRVGGSKASLYSYFGNKQGLFDDLITARCQQFLHDIGIPTEVEGNLQKTLLAFGKRFLRTYSDPKRVATMRAVIAEATRFPELAQRLYDHGPKRGRRMLGEFFRDCHRQKLLYAPQPELAATYFLELIKGACMQRTLLGQSPLPPGVSVDAFVAGAVRVFLHGSSKR